MILLWCFLFQNLHIRFHQYRPTSQLQCSSVSRSAGGSDVPAAVDEVMNNKMFHIPASIYRFSLS